MKKNYKTFSKKTALIFSALLLVGSLAANAQMETNGGIGLPNGDPNIPDAPIDGFLSIGLIAGAAIGLRKKIIGLKS